MRLEICLYLLYREHRERGQEGTKDRGEGRHTDVRDVRDTRDARDVRDARDKDERDERRGPELKESRLDATVRKYVKESRDLNIYEERYLILNYSKITYQFL
jgi:hypothetical protein